MDQTKLQEQIAIYYKKLPEETKMLFAGMSWLETLKEIDTKYALDDEQIKTLGTETTILLLSIITPDDYEQTIRTELKLEEEKTNNLIKEINEKIIKDIAPLIYKAYSDNINDFIDEAYEKNFDGRFSKLEKNVQDAIAMSQWREKLYLIANKYNLPFDKQGTLEEITIQTLAGTLRADQYENEIKSKISIPEEKTRLFITEINEAIFKSIKEIMISDSYLPENTSSDIPIPPYAAKITKEDPVPIPPKPMSENVITKNNVPLPTQINTNAGDNDMYRENGIEILQENAFPKNELRNSALNQVPLPPKRGEAPVVNIIADKLTKQTASETTVTNYSIPKITPKLEPFSNVQGSNTANPHDPYHEAI